MTVTTEGACGSGDALIGKIFGSGFPADGQIVVSNSPLAAYRTTMSGGMIVPLGQTIRDFMNEQPNPVALSGSYRIVVTCRDKIRPASLGDFATTVTFTTARTFVAPTVKFDTAPLADPNGPTSGLGGAPAGQTPAAGLPSAGGDAGALGSTPIPVARAATADPPSNAAYSAGSLVGVFGLGVLATTGIAFGVVRLRGRKSSS